MEDSKLVRVAVDAMGGDYAPSEIVKGAVNALLSGCIFCRQRRLSKWQSRRSPRS